MTFNKKLFVECGIVGLLEALAAIIFGRSEFAWLPMLFFGAAGAAIIASSFRYEVLKLIAQGLLALVVFLASVQVQYVLSRKRPL